MQQAAFGMGDQKQGGLAAILNSGEPSEAVHRDIMQVELIPFSPDLPIGVYFIKTYGAETKYIPRSAIPEKFRNVLDFKTRYVVAGNLMTRYAKDIRFTEFRREPDPLDGII